MPRAGGVYVFLTEAYGGLTGFLYGWAYFLVVNTGGIAALAVAFSTYLGYIIPAAGEHTTIVAIAGIIIVTLIVTTNVAYMFLLSPAEMADSSRIASDAIGVVLGAFGGGLIALTIFISTFGTTGIYTLTAPRIYYAMANDGVFFKKVAEVHPRFRTPMFSIIFQSIWAIVLILFWGTFESLISYVVFTDWIFFALTAASVFLFRRRLPNAERPYKTLGYPATPFFSSRFRTCSWCIRFLRSRLKRGQDSSSWLSACRCITPGERKIKNRFVGV